MARAATTTDAFNAVAEPRRRQILDLLAAGERPVNDLVALLGLAQPQISKHLRVLREVELVLEYRDSLVAAIVTGKLDVRNAEIAAVERDDLIDEVTIPDDLEDALDAVD